MFDYKQTLRSSKEFLEYQDSLSKKYPHMGEPDRYPCLVYSEFRYDPNGPDYYDHNFIYYEDIVELVKAQFELEAEQELTNSLPEKS